MFKKIEAKSHQDAINQAKRMRRCIRMSFEGVAWEDSGVWREIPWEVADRTRYGQG